MSQRPIVLLLIPHLGGGGAEKVVELLTRHLNPRKYELHLGLITEKSPSSAHIPPHVTVHCLCRRRVRTAAISLLALIHQIRPTVILSSMAHLNFLVLLLRPLFPRGTRVLVRQNGTVSSMLHDQQSPRTTCALYRLLYPRADRILCQSQAMADDLSTLCNVLIAQLAVLYNPVEHSAESQRASTGPPGSASACTLLTVSRLSREKGIDLLLDALPAILSRFTGVRLFIAGTGPEEPHLRRQCQNLRIADSVQFLGHRDSLFEHFRQADLFVLPSRHEGMPNSLLEAADAGLPIVATPACGGIVDLLSHAPGVWITSEASSPSLAAAIASALPCLSLNARFDHEWLRPFRLECAITAYEDLIDLYAGPGCPNTRRIA